MAAREVESSAILTAGGAKAYRDRLGSIIERVDLMGWGARARVAKGTDLAPSTISNVLNGRLISNMHLNLIEEYLDTNKESYDG